MPQDAVEKPRVLVTGGSGFVGRFAPKFLLARGCDVHLITRDGRDAPGGRLDAAAGSCTIHPVDLLGHDGWERRVSQIRATHLLHFAWDTRPGLYWSAPDNLDWLTASVRLVQAFVAGGGTRAVLAGSCAEYDWRYSILDETTTPLSPATLYGTAKASLNRTLATAAATLGLSLAWGHIFFPFGPFEKPGRLLSDVIPALLAGREVACSEGRQVRDFIHVEDCARAFAELLLGPVEGRVNIGSGLGHSLREVVDLAAARIGRPELVRYGARPMAANDPPCLIARTERLHSEVGFRPTFDFPAAIDHAIAWWRDARD